MGIMKMKNKKSRYLVVLDSSKRTEIFLDILEFCEWIVKKSRILSDEKNGLLNALYGLKEYWKEPEKCVKIDERHLVIDPQRESMEFFYDFGRFCEKEKCSVYFRMNGFSRIREEKKKVIWRRKKQLDQRGLPVYFQMVPVLDVWNNFSIILILREWVSLI